MKLLKNKIKLYNQNHMKSIFLKLTKNKGMEINFHHKFILWFNLSLAIRTKGDHPGFMFECFFLGIGIEIDFYDFRHDL